MKTFWTLAMYAGGVAAIAGAIYLCVEFIRGLLRPKAPAPEGGMDMEPSLHLRVFAILLLAAAGYTWLTAAMDGPFVDPNPGKIADPGPTIIPINPYARLPGSPIPLPTRCPPSSRGPSVTSRAASLIPRQTSVRSEIAPITGCN